ncbi:PARN [Lepeophtheirus salmonis]|uniref:Poly(A)-specific ribonuclease PARN n=1 Tax=Lepeophtheirus salmonis TaxID=72036 RepID=A0A7R8CFY3_LEPSM|nr:PARN [Lepeophtheirus salmonis]CAF2810888.1 PARN [Lepeophtheirus salmonis]
MMCGWVNTLLYKEKGFCINKNNSLLSIELILIPNRRKKEKIKMDVTKRNFDEGLLNQIREEVDSCSFVSFDCEFSGIHAESNVCSLDSLSERYEKTIRPSITQFIVFQFGLSIFSPGSISGTLKNRSYNFHVWQGSSVPSMDVRFLCQSSSIDFLAGQNFDFNKLFKEGISYIRLSDASRLKQNLIEKQNTKLDYPSSIAIPEQQEDFLKDIHQRIQKYISDDKEEEAPLELPSCNGFQRKLIYQTVRETFGQEVYLETNKKRLLLVNKLRSREKNQQLELEEFDKILGFSKIVRIISESKKPLVGHNMMLDLCFTINQFVAPLPETYEEFKTLAHKMFPEVYDTKVMANIGPVKEHVLNSTLEDLVAKLKESPFKIPKLESKDDAYAESGPLPRGRISLKIVLPYSNKIAVMRINDVPYLNLDGDDIFPDRSHVFYVTFPSLWKTTDLNSLFSSFGNVQIKSSRLRHGLSQLLSSVYSLTPYDKHKNGNVPSSITPLLEKSDIFNTSNLSSPTNNTKKARSIPNGTPDASLKRSKISNTRQKNIFRHQKSLLSSQSVLVMRLVLYNFCVSFALFLISLLYYHYCNVKDYIQILHCGIPRRTFPLDLRYIIGNYTGKGGTKKLSRYVDEMINYKDLWPLYSFEEIFPYRRFDGTYDLIYIKGKEAWRMSCPIKRLDMNQTDFTCFDVTVPDPARKNFISKRRWTEVRRWGMTYIHSPIEGVKGEEDLLDEQEAGPYSNCMPDWDIGDILYFWMPDFHIEFLFNIG